MSTKATRECLLAIKQDLPVGEALESMADKAIAELEAIERAAKALSAEVLDVEASVDAIGLMQSIAKDAP